MSVLKQGKSHQLSSFNLWMIRAGSAKDASCKGHNLTTLFIHVFKIFVNQKGFFFGGGMFCFGFFGSVWPWENSVPCYSHIAIPAYETISCRWCLSLIFHVLHMSIHTRKAHSCSYCTRKTGKCFQTEDLLSSFHQRKQTSLAFTDFLDCCASQTSSVLKPPLVFQDPQLRTAHCGCFYGTTCCLTRHWVLEVVDLRKTIKRFPGHR